MKPEVFISYSRKDWDFVIRIVQHLRDAGVSVWVDQGGIDGALLWAQEIVEAIENCKVMILMASDGSFASRNVVKEVALASEKNIYILPILLEAIEIPKTMKYQLAGVQHIEFFHGNFKDNMQAIVRSLSRLGVHTEDLDETPEPPSVIVSSPHHNEKHVAGGNCLIQWQAQATLGRKIVRSRVELIQKTKAPMVIAGENQNLSGDDSSYVWAIPQELNPDNEYRVKVIVWDDKGERGEAFSNGSFVIQAPTERPAKVEQEILSRLKSIEILSALTNEEIAQVAKGSIVQELPPGKVVGQRGEMGASMFIVHRGEIKVQTDHDGVPRMLALHKEGEVLGDWTLFGGNPRSADYAAGDEGSEVIEVGFQVMRSIFQANPEVMDAIIHLVVKRRAEIHNPVLDAEWIATWSNELSRSAKRWFNIGLLPEIEEAVEQEIEQPEHTNKPWWKFW